MLQESHWCLAIHCWQQRILDKKRDDDCHALAAWRDLILMFPGNRGADRE